MCQHQHDDQHGCVSRMPQRTCCPQAHGQGEGVSRREFLGAAAAGGMVLGGLSWSVLAAAEPGVAMPPPRKPLVVKPVLFYDVYMRHHQTSWRQWGGIQTPQDVEAELPRIQAELQKLKGLADFPLEFLPLASIRGAGQLEKEADVAKADAFLVYAAGGNVHGIEKLGKNVIFFMRYRSGPVYLWYEIISPRYLRQHTDVLSVKGVDDQDCVVDSLEEVLWRLRALCGLKNTVGSRILAVGGPGAWAQPGQVVPDLVRKIWKIDIVTIPYPELGKLIKAARGDQAEVQLARRRAAEYLQLPQTTLETERPFVENAFLLDQIFRKLMAQSQCRAITINGCMGTIMPLAETSACLTLSTLNDDGYLAFCESDFVVIPAGILLNGISGRPTFLNDPTYPHQGIITLAHCTAPRKMDGKNREPARIMTHFESDYGAAPKVEMHTGQVVTNIIPDFKSQRWVGLLGEIVAHDLLPICRSQIDIKFTCSSHLLAERMPGFHWMTGYGDYLKELGYALKRVGIQWEVLA